MRISDWSSDVCSSDLGSSPAAIRAGVSRNRRGRSMRSDRHFRISTRSRFRASARITAESSGSGPAKERSARPSGAAVFRARQSVVEGKSGDVRVDFGGWLYIKKKKQNIQISNI